MTGVLAGSRGLELPGSEEVGWVMNGTDVRSFLDPSSRGSRSERYVRDDIGEAGAREVGVEGCCVAGEEGS